MVNLNGSISDSGIADLQTNRAFLYGDAVFETIKYFNNQPLYAEEHYFRLMAGMRIVRMDIPMNFTLEFMESEIKKTVDAQKVKADSYSVRMTCFRKPGGKYLPTQKGVEFMITVQPLEGNLYPLNERTYEVELYKDFYAPKQLLSTIKSTNRLLNITAAVYAEELGLQNAFLINDDKSVIEAVNGNVFIISKQTVVTPPISDGCIKGIMRERVIEEVKKWTDYEFVERSISPFELQKANEIWITNTIMGIQPVTQYRRKSFENKLALKCTQQLNARLNNFKRASELLNK